MWRIAEDYCRKSWLPGLLLAAAGVCPAALAATADSPAPPTFDPGMSRGAQYLSVSNEVSRQRAALERAFERTRADVVARINSRREALHAATDDAIERDVWGRELDALYERAIAELRGVLARHRERLNALRRDATAELSRDGAVSDSTWAAISGYASAHRFSIPQLVRAAPPIDLAPMYSGFAAALYECVIYDDTYEHPATWEPMSRRILGVSNGRCHYEEEMPADGLRTCHFSLERLTALADHYADERAHARLRRSSRNAFVAGRAVTINTWMLDGKPYDHPVDEATAAGECVISGY